MDQSKFAAIVALFVFLLIAIPFIVFILKRQATQASELKDLYRQSIELNREGNAIMRELIEALRAKK
ncbi:MAG TPA: hypothetical protein VGM05_21095 [Planctomycetaceae bacterium]|jgi:preprotein translocase subunit YajC